MNADDPSTVSPDLAAFLGRPVRTVPALLQARARASSTAPALWVSAEGSGWRSTSWRQYHDAVAAAARAIQALGLDRGERVAIIAPNSPRWDIAQCAAMAAGGVVVGLDPNDTDERLQRIGSRCGLAAVIAQDETLLQRLGPESRGGLRFVATFEPPKTTGVVSFADLTTAARSESGTDWDRSHPEDNALITFTSGTSGEPKGIAYTHRQVCGAVASILQAFPGIAPESRLACWLPLANLFQRMINLCAVGRGAQTFYVANPATIMEHVAAISPHVFIGVPRFYEKLYDAIAQRIDGASRWQRWLAAWALRVGERQARAHRQGDAPSPLQSLQFSVAERLVLRRIRAVLGASLRFMISGSAPMPLWLLERFHALGLPVLEAYGMSECITPIAANRPDAFRLGTVGRPLAGIEVELAPDGELLVRGAGVCSGYVGDLRQDGRVSDRGGFASGDYADVDSDGFIVLRGRKSEVFKTSAGRRIAPTTVEECLRRISYVEHAAVFGENRARPVALVSVSLTALAARLGATAPVFDLLQCADAIKADVSRAVAGLPGYLRPEGLVATTRQFTAAGGELTPNLKLRRAAMQQNFASDLDALFALLDRSGDCPAREQRDGGRVVLLRL